MATSVKDFEGDVLEQVFAEFNEELQNSGKADFSLLERCPQEERQELRSLMNVAALARKALQLRQDAEQNPERIESTG